MTGIFFLNKMHASNFQKLADHFPKAKNISDYQAACYLAALPEIFKCFSLKKQINGPFDWYFDYLDDNEDFIRRRNQGETSGDTAPLTGQTRILVELALNLWNGRVFDLTEGISTWDTDLYHVALQAIDLRRSRRKLF